MRRALPGRVSLCVLLQTDINENMRAILIDWLVEVHYKFKVSAATLTAAYHMRMELPPFPLLYIAYVAHIMLGHLLQA